MGSWGPPSTLMGKTLHDEAAGFQQDFLTLRYRGQDLLSFLPCLFKSTRRASSASVMGFLGFFQGRLDACVLRVVADLLGSRFVFAPIVRGNGIGVGRLPTFSLAHRVPRHMRSLITFSSCGLAVSLRSLDRDAQLFRYFHRTLPP
jgi:hypothetical protein